MDEEDAPLRDPAESRTLPSFWLPPMRHRKYTSVEAVAKWLGDDVPLRARMMYGEAIKLAEVIRTEAGEYGRGYHCPVPPEQDVHHDICALLNGAKSEPTPGWSAERMRDYRFAATLYLLRRACACLDDGCLKTKIGLAVKRALGSVPEGQTIGFAVVAVLAWPSFD